MITLSEAYNLVKPHIFDNLEIDVCVEYEDYFSFPERELNGERITYIDGGIIGVQKSSGRLCHIGFNIEKFCDCAWDYETGNMVSDDIGKPIKEYDEKELKVLA